MRFTLVRCLIILFPSSKTSVKQQILGTAGIPFVSLTEIEVFIYKSHTLDPILLNDFPISVGKLWSYAFMNADVLVLHAAHDHYFVLTENQKLVNIS